MTTRDTAIDRATAYFDSGAFLADLSRRVAYPTESRPPADTTKLRAYLTDELAPAARRLGATPRIIDNPVPTAYPFLLAHRHESDDLPTVLVYGHADVVPGQDDHWRTGLSPGTSSSRATASTAAAPPTTRASTRSTWPRWNRSWPREAAPWASTSSC